MHEYFVELLARRRGEPGDDVVSQVAQAEMDGQRLTDLEIEDLFVVRLLGGIDNTTKLLASMFWRLAWDPELRRRVTDRPALLATAVDEFLRYYSPAYTCRPRGRPGHRGRRDHGARPARRARPADRQPRPAPVRQPRRLRPERAPNRHLGLGLGIHRCLGAHLVRDLPVRWLCGQVSGMETVPIVFPPGGGPAA